MNRLIDAADIYCGGGGSSTGLSQACAVMGYDLNLLAVNHWPIAIDTHSANHTKHRHLCTGIDNVSPRQLRREGVIGERLDLLWASPECTSHAYARGNKPVNDQSRDTAWRVLDWLEATYVETLILENLKEFKDWGPLGADGRPIKEKKGKTFLSFLASLRSLDYKVSYRVLNAADYGDATARERFFLIARRGDKPIKFPAQTHAPAHMLEQKNFFRGSLKPHRTAREIIDWTLRGESIFTRKTPLCKNTIKRISAGLQEFCGQAFIVELRKNKDVRSLDLPLSTIATSGAHHALCEPYLVKFTRTGGAQSVDLPLDTITTKDRFGLVIPEMLPVADIRFRMLQPHELSAAMGFPKDYFFAGTREAQVRQIGNAVCVGMAEALCKAVLN